MKEHKLFLFSSRALHLREREKILARQLPLEEGVNIKREDRVRNRRGITCRSTSPFFKVVVYYCAPILLSVPRRKRPIYNARRLSGMVNII